MTKEEKIKEAYGEYWEESKSFINENGWMNAKEWLGGIGNTQIFTKLKGVELECMDNYDPKYCYWFRPKSLNGIEDNNGWTKIESIADLPKEKGFYLFLSGIGHTTYGVEDVNYAPEWFAKKYTHWKPKQEYKNPLY